MNVRKTMNDTSTRQMTDQRGVSHVGCNGGFGSLTGGCLVARGGRVLRHGEVIGEGDYTVNGGLVNPATPVPPEWVGRRIFEGLPQPSVIRLPNTPVTDAEPPTPANTRAQGPRSV